jgi:hypothetical protein
MRGHISRTSSLLFVFLFSSFCLQDANTTTIVPSLEKREQKQDKITLQETQKRQRIEQKIHTHNLADFRSLGLIDLFMKDYCGNNVTIAVIEAGFYYSIAPQYRPSLKGIGLKGKPTSWYTDHQEQILPPLSFYDPVSSPIDSRFEGRMERGKGFRFDHGDFVLSILAETAPHAKILPVQASFGRTGESFVRALEFLSQRDDVKIINLSRWLESCPHDELRLNPAVLAALRRCTDKGKIIVLAAGNTPYPVPKSPSAACNQIDPMAIVLNLLSDLIGKMTPTDSLRSHVVISGALKNSTNQQDRWSGKAGIAQDNYIATYGRYYSSIQNRTVLATSMSTPRTTAILADLMSARPDLPPSTIVRKMFETADRTMPYYTAEEYGHGNLRVAQAVHDLTAP